MVHVYPRVGHDVSFICCHLQFLWKLGDEFPYILKQNLLATIYSLLIKSQSSFWCTSCTIKEKCLQGFFSVQSCLPCHRMAPGCYAITLLIYFFKSLSFSFLVVKLSVSCHFLLLSVSLPLSHPQFDAANLLSAEKSDNQDLWNCIYSKWYAED